MASDSIVDRYRRAIQAFNDNDIAKVEELVAPDIVYTFHGNHPVAGVYHGIDGFKEVLTKAKQLTDGTASLKPIAVVSDNVETIMVWGVFRGTRSGRLLETNHAYYYRFKDGRLVEGHTIPVDQADANAFWSA